MHLKEIEMENFKSFKGKAKVSILDGYTVITGPNGCGKSNLLDAVLFVLGPKSSKVIRAGKLTDLIFNGAKEGRGASFCKVSLTFENGDQMLPVNTDEVTLTRMVKKTNSEIGYSSNFYVNGRKSTLSEFDEILSHARISADGYNIVQQGYVTDIIKKGGVERRRILEDIAGITVFDNNIAEAEKEKEGAEANLDRIGIILSELNKESKQLEKDRVEALKYREIKDKLDLTNRQISFKEKSTIENEISGLNDQISKSEETIAAKKEEKDNIQKKIEEKEEELARLENDISEQGGEKSKKMKEKGDAIRLDLARAKDAIETAQDKIRTLKEDISELKGSISDLDEAVGGQKEKYDSLMASLKEEEEKLDALKKEKKELEDVFSNSDVKLRNLRKEQITLKKDLESAEEKIHSLTLEKDLLASKRDRLTEELAKLEESKKDYAFQLKDLKWHLKELRSKQKDSGTDIKKLQDDFHKKKNDEVKLGKELVELENAISSLTREYNHLLAQAEAEKSVQDGYNTAVRGVLDARNRGILKGIHGTVAELADVDPRYETAIETAAGPRMQAIVVDDDAAAAKAIDFLKKKKLGRAAFLPLNKMMSGHPRGKALMVVKECEGFAIDLVKFDEKYSTAFWYVLGDTVVVDKLENARKHMGGVRLVTLGGDLVEAAGAMIGGKREKKMLRFGSVDRSEIEKIGNDLAKATDHADRTREKLSRIKIEVIESEKLLKEESAKTGTSGSEIGEFDVKVAEYTKLLKDVEKDISKKSADLKELDPLLKSVKSDLDAFKDKRNKASEKLTKANEKSLKIMPEEASKNLNQYQNDIQNSLSIISEKKTSANTLKAEMEMNRKRLNEMYKRLKGLEGEIGSNEKIIKENKEKSTDLDTELRALVKIEDSFGSKMQELRKARDEVYKEKTDLWGEKEKIDHFIDTKHDFLLGMKRELGNAQQRLSEATAGLDGMEIEGKIPAMDVLKRTKQQCESSIEAMGAVNMRAVELYDEKASRYEELNNELKELKDRRRKLIALVKELNEKKKTGLLKVYEGVNERFKDVYAQLSGGGEAKLVLENMEKPFDGGLVIQASPSGKRVRRIEALSGGEQGVVSMAFIFAIQMYDPSPFYMLDEIDQNLDSNNTEKVAKMVRKISHRAQFLQISLKKVTLREADNIVGVTMQNPGRSDIVMQTNISPTEKPKDNSGEDMEKENTGSTEVPA